MRIGAGEQWVRKPESVENPDTHSSGLAVLVRPQDDDYGFTANQALAIGVNR